MDNNKSLRSSKSYRSVQVPSSLQRFVRCAQRVGGVLLGGSMIAGAAVLYSRRRSCHFYPLSEGQVDRLEVGSGVAVRIHFGYKDSKIKLRAPRSLYSRVFLSLQGGCLSVHRLPVRFPWQGGRLEVHLYVPFLREICLSGGQVDAFGVNHLEEAFVLRQIAGQLRGLSLQAPLVDLHLRGAARASCTLRAETIATYLTGPSQLHCHVHRDSCMHLSLRGTPQVSLEGDLSSLSIEGEDGARLEAPSCRVDRCDVHLMGHSHVLLSMVNRLSYTLSEQSNLVLREAPKHLERNVIEDSASILYMSAR